MSFEKILKDLPSSPEPSSPLPIQGEPVFFSYKLRDRKKVNEEIDKFLETHPGWKASNYDSWNAQVCPPTPPRKNPIQRINSLECQFCGANPSYKTHLHSDTCLIRMNNYCQNCGVKLGLKLFIGDKGPFCQRCYDHDDSPPKTSPEFLEFHGYTECANCCCSLQATPEELPKKCESCIFEEKRLEEDYAMNCSGCKRRRGHTWNCCFFSWNYDDIIAEEREAHAQAFHKKLMNRNCYCGFKGVIVEPRDKRKREEEEGTQHQESLKFLREGYKFLLKSEETLKHFEETLNDYKKFLEEEKGNLTEEDDE